MIGMERPPALRDRAAMPYTDAVIHEVQRFLDLIPLGFVRTVARDTPLGGFTIPKVWARRAAAMRVDCSRASASSVNCITCLITNYLHGSLLVVSCTACFINGVGCTVCLRAVECATVCVAY